MYRNGMSGLKLMQSLSFLGLSGKFTISGREMYQTHHEGGEARLFTDDVLTF